MTIVARQRDVGNTRDSFRLLIVEGATHIDTYHVPEYVQQVEAKLVEFFGRTLDESGRSSSDYSSPQSAETAESES